MANIDRIELVAEPIAIDAGKVSTITATVLDNEGHGIKGETVTFKLDDKVGKLNNPSGPTDDQGKAWIELTATKVSGGKAFTVNASNGTVSSSIKVDVKADADPLNQKLLALDTLQEEANKLARESDDKKKQIEQLKQDIEGLRKVTQTPDEISEAVKKYDEVLEKNKKDLKDLQPAIQPIEDAISAKLNDKAKLGEISGKRSRFDQEITTLKASLEQLDRSISDLRDVKIKEAVKARDTKKTDFDKLLATKTKLEDGLKRLKELKTEAETENNKPDRKSSAYAYLAILDAKDKLTGVQGLIMDPPALEKKLNDAWKQYDTKRAEIRSLANELEQKKIEQEAIKGKLKSKGLQVPEPPTDLENAARKTELRLFIDSMMSP